jgi:tetratricopeptide (TPR) repeat protein
MLLLLAAFALLAAGCGSDSDSKDDSEKKKPTKEQAAVQKDRDAKEKNVKAAEKEFKKDDENVGTCRNVAMAWIALASPASSTDPKKPAELPKDRDESLDKAVVTLEKCVEIDDADRDVKQMLASTYMATSAYDKASPLLEDLAKSAKGPERPNAYYAWGLAASNAQEYRDAITAWRTFIELSPKNDPRIAQVRQSIKALQDAAKQPKPAAEPAADEAEDKPAADEGDEDAPADE